MPTPIGHSISAVLLNELRIFRPAKSFFKSIFISLILANLADVDFLPGILLGNPNQFHHGVTHSLGAGLLVGFLFAVYFYYRENRFFAPFAFATSLYFSHVVMDYFTMDTSLPRGVPLFGPMSVEYFISPISIFSDVYKDSSTVTFLQSLLVGHNAWTILREIIILAPLTIIIIFWQKYKKNHLDFLIDKDE